MFICVHTVYISLYMYVCRTLLKISSYYAELCIIINVTMLCDVIPSNNKYVPGVGLIVEGA